MRPSLIIRVDREFSDNLQRLYPDDCSFAERTRRLNEFVKKVMKL